MRNLTITVDEEVIRWAKIWAATHDTSVSRLVGELLRQRMVEEEGYDVAKNQYLSLRPVELKKGGPYPSRETLHDRNGLR
jgi:plasmid stability protein